MKSSFRNYAMGIATIICSATTPLSSAFAHHSAAAFDINVKATLSGTVKTFLWSNPHCWITLVVPNAAGGTDEWAVEGASVSILVRNGWRANTIAPGDHVKLVISPRKDAAPGGEFFTVVEKNGEPINLVAAN